MEVSIKVKIEPDLDGDIPLPRMGTEQECRAPKTEPVEEHIWEVPVMQVVDIKCEYDADPVPDDELTSTCLEQQHQVRSEPAEQEMKGVVSDQKAGAMKRKRAADNASDKNRKPQGAPPRTGDAQQQCGAAQRAEPKKPKRPAKAAGLQQTHQSEEDATTESGNKPHQCEVCHKSYFSAYNLQTHFRLHTGEKPYACHICQRRFNQNVRLQRHLITHTGEKPFECNICHRRYTEKPVLKAHLRIHTGEKPFQCNICQRRFTERPTLQRHLATHKAEKPFECDICHRRFARKDYLKEHFFIHSGEKPYKCKICQRRFAKKFNLRTHIETHTTYISH